MEFLEDFVKLNMPSVEVKDLEHWESIKKTGICARDYEDIIDNEEFAVWCRKLGADPYPADPKWEKKEREKKSKVLDTAEYLIKKELGLKVKVYKTDRAYFNGWMISAFDALAKKGKEFIGIEVKLGWSDPNEFENQAQWNMYVCNLKRFIVICFNDSEYKIKVFKRKNVQDVSDVWDSIQMKTPICYEYHPIAYAVEALKKGLIKVDKNEASSDLWDYSYHKACIRDHLKDLNMYKEKFKHYPPEFLNTEDGRICIADRVIEEFNIEKFKKDHPDLYKKYTKEVKRKSVFVAYPE